MVSLDDLPNHLPVKETGWSGYSEWSIETLYEIDGIFYIHSSTFNVFQSEPDNEIRQVSLIEAVGFLDRPDTDVET